MPIYQNSRYGSTALYTRDDKSIFKIRKVFNFNLDNAQVHEFREGDRLDNLATRYYNDSQLWWVILEANKYRCEIDIPIGELLFIPEYDQVVRLIE